MRKGLVFVAVAMLLIAPAALAQFQDFGLHGSQVVLGQGWSTDLQVVNGSASSQWFWVAFLKTGYGRGYTFTSYFRPLVDGSATGADWIKFQLAPGTGKTLHISVPNPNQFVAGWLCLYGGTVTGAEQRPLPAEVTANLIRKYGNDEYASPLVRAANRFVFPAVLTTNSATGIAITNSGAAQWDVSWVKFRAFDAQGKLIAEQPLNLFPGNKNAIGCLPSGMQMAQFLWQFFKGNPDWESYINSHAGFNGTVEIVADGYPISATALVVKY